MRQRISSLPPWTFSVLTLLVICWLTLFPKPFGEESPQLFEGADKVVHALMFGGLSIMILLDYQRRHNWMLIKWTGVALASILSFLIGVGIEYLQLAMSLGRGFEIGDIIADAVGSLLAANLWLIFQASFVPASE